MTCLRFSFEIDLSMFHLIKSKFRSNIDQIWFDRFANIWRQFHIVICLLIEFNFEKSFWHVYINHLFLFFSLFYLVNHIFLKMLRNLNVIRIVRSSSSVWTLFELYEILRRLFNDFVRNSRTDLFANRIWTEEFSFTVYSWFFVWNRQTEHRNQI